MKTILSIFASLLVMLACGNLHAIQNPQLVPETIEEISGAEVVDHLLGGLSYINADTDKDGIPDRIERSVVKQVYKVHGEVWIFDPGDSDVSCSSDVLSCWYKADTDDDGVRDGLEHDNPGWWVPFMDMTGDEPFEDRVVDAVDTDDDGRPDVRERDSDDDGLRDGEEDRGLSFFPDSEGVLVDYANGQVFQDIHGDSVSCTLAYGYDEEDLGVSYRYYRVTHYGESKIYALACQNESVLSPDDFNGLMDPSHDHSDARTIDTDGDGFCDGQGPGCGDMPRDHCPTVVGGPDSYNGCPPSYTDSDGDGLTDDEEDANQNGFVEYNLGETNPFDPDSDDDGLMDGIEVSSNTDPLNPDTDADDLLDGVEDANHNGIFEPQLGETDPRYYDTDDDGLNDGLEIGMNTDPLNPDTDADGIFDGDETPGCALDPEC